MMQLEGFSKQVLLVICDGMGYSENRDHNAVFDAHTPNLDMLIEKFPFTTLAAGGELVGLPKGVAGNSEVGHLNLGSGQSVRQDLVRINEAIEKQTLQKMDKFKELVQVTQDGSKRLHLLTLLSDGGVHAHIDHLKEILTILDNKEIEVYLHAFMDGRDTPLDSGEKYLKEIADFGKCTIASIQGRSIGMDRDRRWEKIESAYKMMTGNGDISKDRPIDYLLSEYKKEIYDEFITPCLFNEGSAIREEDSVFFLNFRPDRAKQISEAFCSDRFNHFENAIRPNYFLCMSPYIDEEFPNVPILFNREKVAGTLIEHLSQKELKSFKIAETEKYAHVTYFFNGGQETPFKGEQRLLIESPKDVTTYDQKPQMSAPSVLKSLVEKLADKSISFFAVNFANPDMVGHTGKYQAAVKAMEKIDECLGELMAVCEKSDISMLITADHGNCDQMTYPDGSPHTSHSNADVPFILFNSKLKKEDIKVKTNDNALKDVAPTILHLLGVKKHSLMSGNTLFS